jgi:hypothetical protein
MKNLFMCVIIAFMGLTSCSSDDDNGSTGGSREIKYEITGDFSGEKIDVTYTTNGGGTNTEVFDLPWAMTFTADSDTHGAGFSVMGMDATPGEKITLKVYKGDSVLKSLEATADSDGSVIGTISATF